MAERVKVVIAVVGVLAVAGAGWLLLHRGAAAPGAPVPAATATARGVRTDVTVRDIVGGTLGYTDQLTVVSAVSGTLTWLPPVGTTVGADGRLYEVDGHGVFLWTGARPAWRDYMIGMPDGPDVGQLERNLVARGFGAGLTVDDHFSSATGDAVQRWQGAHGLPRTGTIRLGEVVYRPGPVRVGALAAALGTPLAPGTPVLSVSGTATQVTVALDPAVHDAVHVGDSVVVTQPGGAHPTPGRIATVGVPTTSVAAAGAQSGRQDSGGTTTTMSIPLTITLTATATSGPDIGPVQVAITSAVDRGVLAVPIDALLAAPGGGFRVALHEGSRRRLVPVRTRLFDESDGLVEVEGLAEGSVVEVPAP